MKRAPVWYWIAIAYLVATVTFNLWTQWRWFHEYPLADKLTFGVNIGCKVLAIIFLHFRRALGVYLLTIAFVVGLGGALWLAYGEHQEVAYSTLTIVSRLNGFAISLAIIVYAFFLKRRGFLNGRDQLTETVSHF